jgi:hypothetical protein
MGLALDDEARALQLRQVRRHGGRGQLEHGRDLADAEPTRTQHAEDAQTRRMTRRLEDLSGLVQPRSRHPPLSDAPPDR